MDYPVLIKKSGREKFKLALLVSIVPASLTSFFFLSVSTYAQANQFKTTQADAKSVSETSVTPAKVEVLDQSIQKITPILSSDIPTQELEDKLKQITNNKDGTQYSITIVDLKADRTFGQNMAEPTHTASVMKVLVATAVYQAIENGQLDLNSSLGGSTVENHLKRMINRSDNFSWDLFYDRLGTETIQSLAEKWGMGKVKSDGNQGSSADFAKLLKLIYTNKILTNEHRKQLYSFMQNTETENLLSLGVSKNIEFYHKTGKYNGGMHDAMIVNLETNPYILVVFSSNDKGLIRERSSTFKQISETVYNHFK